MQTKVSDILAYKGGEIFTIEKRATVYEAVAKMVASSVGALLVVENGNPCGIITERDYLRKVVLENRSSKSTEVATIMTSRIACASPEDTLEQCMATMTSLRCRHLPVMKDGQSIGMLSMGDLVKKLALDQRSEIRYLEDYITGRYPG